MVNPRLAVIPISPQINLHCLIVMSWVWGGVLPARGGGWGSTGIMPLLALSPSLFWGLGAGSRGGVALLANAGDNQQKTNYPW